MNKFDAIVLITPPDYIRLKRNYGMLRRFFNYGDIVFLGSAEVKRLVEADDWGSGVRAVDENEILDFSSVHAVMSDVMSDILMGRELPRGITAWYYQQFLKMNYSSFCADDYYLVWDGDTFPCRSIGMFSSENGKPYLDLKVETHLEYFDTMARLLPGFRKVIEKSFISEHMLMRVDVMRELMSEIMSNAAYEGESFWEKIIRSIPADIIQNGCFSEYETYGTYVALRHPDIYRLRDWHSFRLGGEFFDPDTISERDYVWLGRDFDAISFEKAHRVREDHANLFDNPDYQMKLSAKQMLQIAQEEFGDGYREIWDDDTSGVRNVSSGVLRSKEQN